MAIKTDLRVRVKSKQDIIELAPAVHAIQFSIVDSSTSKPLEWGYWVYHIDAKTNTYCKVVLPKLFDISTASRTVVCRSCGLSGVLEDGEWHERGT